MKKQLLVIGLLAVLGLISSTAHAGRNVTSDPVHGNWGNMPAYIQVTPSTQTFKLISSQAVNSGLGIAEWQHRQIVNYTDGGLFIAETASTFDQYLSTVGIHIDAGGTYTVPHQGDVYGISAPATTLTGGIGGEQTYQKH